MKTILVVDDEPIVREVVVRYLEREGYRTLEAGDGDAARSAIEHTRSRSRRARRDAAGDRRPRALPLDPLAVGAPRDHADGAWRGGRSHRRARARRRRLPDEAVLAARARRARAERAAPVSADRRAERAHRLRRGRARARDARGAQGGHGARAHSEGVRPPLVPGEPPATRLLARPADDGRLGLRGGARLGNGDRPRAPAAREDRGRPFAARATCRRSGASGTGWCRDLDRARRRRLDARRRARARVPPATPADGAPSAGRARVPGGAAPARGGAAVRVGHVPHGRRREDPRGRPRRRRSPRSSPRWSSPARSRTRSTAWATRPRRWREASSTPARRRAGPQSWPRSRARSTRWARTSSGCSTRGASWSPGRATTCGRRSRACRRCWRRSRTGSESRRSTYRPCATRCASSRSLVDDLFELARIDADALTLELRRLPIAPVVSSSLRGVEAEARLRHVRLASEVDEALTRPLRPGEARACAHEPPDERAAAHAGRRLGRGARGDARRRGARRGRGHRRGARRGSARADVRALLARPTVRARRAEPGSASRSRAASSRRTAGGSGPRTAKAAAPACASRCPRPEL